jgi:hypothetical protein
MPSSDDDGNVIPISRRFDRRNSNVKYSVDRFAGEDGEKYIRGEESERTGQQERANMVDKQAQNITKYVPEEAEMAENRKNLLVTKPVALLTGNEFPKGETPLLEQVAEYFQSINSRVKNGLLGDIALTRSGIKDNLLHGFGRLKALTFKAVPNVLRDGAIINYIENHKGRGYESAIIAAPISVAGERHYVAAVVNRNRNSQGFYLHEVYESNKRAGLFKSVSGLLQGMDDPQPRHNTSVLI